jgi:hypothetical protein
MKLFAVKVGGSLVPEPESVEDFEKIGAGEIVEIEIKKRRNIRFHRKFFALLKVAFDNQDTYSNPEHFRKAVLLESGHYEMVKIGEKIVFDVSSISFARCDEFKFSQIYDKALDIIIEKYCKGSTAEEINEAVARVMDFS